MKKVRYAVAFHNAHAGKVELSKALAKKNIEAFEVERVDYIVNNAGAVRLIEYDELFADDLKWRERVFAG